MRSKLAGAGVLALALLVPTACGGSQVSPQEALAANQKILGQAAGTSTGTTGTTEATSPTDYAAPGPYPVGTIELTIGGADPKKVYVYYPADPARLGEGTPVTSYSSAVAFPEALRPAIPAQLVQDIALDVTADAPVADSVDLSGRRSYSEYQDSPDYYDWDDEYASSEYGVDGAAAATADDDDHFRRAV